MDKVLLLISCQWPDTSRFLRYCISSEVRPGKNAEVFRDLVHPYIYETGVIRSKYPFSILFRHGTGEGHDIVPGLATQNR